VVVPAPELSSIDVAVVTKIGTTGALRKGPTCNALSGSSIFATIGCYIPDSLLRSSQGDTVMEIFSKLLVFIETRSAKLAFAALIISSLLVACAIAIVSVSYDNGWKVNVPQTFKLAFVVAYFIIFVASWFILYLLNSKDASDVYSEARELLKGAWVVTYQEAHGPVSSSVVVPKRATPCFISINPENLKLELVFQVRDNPIFKDDDKQQIRDVGFRYNEEGGYTMFYYYTGQRSVHSNISESIIAEGDPSEITIEIFGRVMFARPGSGKSVVDMSGHWYDLNGNLSRLFALLDMKKVAEIRREDFAPVRLSDVPIHSKYFDADMGEVAFSRLSP
jgi:hypothetical protein